MAEEIIETQGEKGSLKATGNDLVEITMNEGEAIPYDELKEMYPDFEIVEDDGKYAKLTRIKT